MLREKRCLEASGCGPRRISGTTLSGALVQPGTARADVDGMIAIISRTTDPFVPGSGAKVAWRRAKLLGEGAAEMCRIAESPEEGDFRNRLAPQPGILQVIPTLF